MSQTIRTFIAIKLPDTILSSIREIQQGMRENGVNLRWVRPENIHLTLKFLGDIAAEDLEKAVAAINDSVENYGPISLAAKGVGVFPGVKRPRVIWVGVSGQLETLVELQKHLENRLAAIGFEKEKRPFKGHLTLGRVKDRIDPKKLADALKSYIGFASETFHARHVVLYKSELKATGAVYTEIARVPLVGQNGLTPA